MRNKSDGYFRDISNTWDVSVTGSIPYPRRIWLHVLLFILTIGSTYLVGLGHGKTGALLYAGSLIAILLTHEMGHFLMARRYGVPATLPFFIPVPLPPFGTMGAVIKMGGRIPNRKALFDIGAAGPLAGMILIIPAVWIGLSHSTVVNSASLGEGSLPLGDSLFFEWAAGMIFGHIQDGYDVVLHPLAYAGWVGLLVTALNLLPIGQLDGGHVVYAVFGRRGRWVSWFFYGALILVCLFFYFGWFLLAIILMLIRRHPPTMNDSIVLGKRRKIIALLILGIFIVSFTPVPFGFGEGLIPLFRGMIQP